MFLDYICLICFVSLGTSPILISITGVPFVGKSSFARSIAKKYKSKYPDFLHYIDTRGLTVIFLFHFSIF